MSLSNYKFFFNLSYFLFFIPLYFSFTTSLNSFDLIDFNETIITENINISSKNSIVYISKSDFIQSLNLKEVDENTFYLSENLLITILKDNSYFSINKKIFNFSYDSFEDAAVEKADIFFPISPFAKIINQYSNQEIFSYSNENLLVDINKIKDINLNSDKEVVSNSEIDSLKKISCNIKKIEINDKSNGIQIKIFANKDFKTDDISSYISADNHLNLTLYKSKIDTNYLNSNYSNFSNIVKKVVPIQLEQSSQITFILDRNKKVISKSISVKKKMISINLFLKKVEEMDDDLIKEKLSLSKDRWKIDRIIIDAGHGGKDPGAIGYRGLKEKTATLGIAKYLSRLLKKDNRLKVFMTRTEDVFVPLEDRTRFANENRGKLFISIHCNAVKQRRVSGFETYFLSPARTEKAMKVAAKENAAIKYESNTNSYKRLTDDNFIVLTMVQDNFAKESEKWASIVQNEIDIFSNTPNRGVDQAGFYVLIGASMPSILVEAGFISNPKEEKLLKSKSYQKKIAKAIYDSIIKLKAEVEKE